MSEKVKILYEVSKDHVVYCDQTASWSEDSFIVKIPSEVNVNYIRGRPRFHVENQRYPFNSTSSPPDQRNLPQKTVV